MSEAVFMGYFTSDKVSGVISAATAEDAVRYRDTLAALRPWPSQPNLPFHREDGTVTLLFSQERTAGVN